MFNHKCNTENHRFKARYSFKFNDIMMQRINKAGSVSIDELKEKIYECDVCIFCGKVVGR